MFGDMFSGMFGKKPEIPMDLMQGSDALGQAAAGDTGAFGSNSSGPGFMGRLMFQFQNMNPMQKYMLMNRIGSGFSSGMNGVMGAKMPQVGNVYQNMTPAQQGSTFLPQPPQGSIFDHSSMASPEDRMRFMQAMQKQGYGRF